MIGQTISHYTILEKLGEGGMGIVYKAHDTKLDRDVALKFLPHHLTATADEQARFLQEARAASALNHPNVCTIYDIVEHEGQQFIVMECIDGKTLRQMVPIQKAQTAIDYAIQIGEALQEAHSKGIVHRDVKTDNIMVNSKNQIKVMDFGLAKLKGSLKLTKTSSTVGTLAYMAPEQIQGGEVDARSDIFSFGVVFYEMLTGYLPFRGEHEAAMMYSILNEEPDPLQKYLPEAPADLQHLLNETLEKNPEDRSQTVGEIVRELRRIRKHTTEVRRGTVPAKMPETEGQIGPAPGPQPIVPRNKLPRRLIFLGIGITFLAVLCAALYLLFFAANKPIDSIAVLPLENVGADPSTEYLSDGITEGIINKLAQLSHLRVAPRPTVFSYKGKLGDPLKTGRELNVRAVFTGKLLHRGERYIVQADLIDVREESQLLGEQYDIATSAIPSLSRDISQKIVERLRVELSNKEQKELGKVPTENSEAYQHYLRGRNYAARFTESSLRAAIDEYQKALSFDSSYTLAYSGISNAYLLLGNAYSIPAREAWQRSTEAAYRALRLDNTNVEALLNLADASYWWEWNWRQAKTQYEHIIEMEPRNFVAHYRLAQLLLEFSRPDEAVEEALQAEKIDPMMEEASTMVGWMFYFRREYEKAISYYQKTLVNHPQYYRARRLLGTACLFTQRNAEAIREIAKAVDFSNESIEEKAYLAYAFAVTGEKEKAQRELTAILARGKQKIVPSYPLALVYTGLGDKDQAFHYLDKAYEERAANMVFLKTEPLFDRLRSDPRFAVLLKKMGLDK